MDTRTALEIASNAGTPVAFIAKRMGKDPSTISKWLRGSSRYLSKETEEELAQQLRELKAEWMKIDI